MFGKPTFFTNSQYHSYVFTTHFIVFFNHIFDYAFNFFGGIIVLNMSPSSNTVYPEKHSHPSNGWLCFLFCESFAISKQA